MSADDGSQQSRLEQVLAAYMQRVDAGEPVNREELLRQHPDLADELREYFEAADQVEHMAGPTAPETIPLNAAAGPAASPLGVVRYFGDYELLEEIGRGGMGVIYKARQVSLNRIVALKMILAGQLASPADVQRFHTEAEAAANLQHPNIVAIHEVGEHEGQHYFSMDYVEGTSLAEMVREHPLPAKQAAGYVKTIAEAIHYAHKKGILHRDLKPSNVLIDGADHPRITDFGLAKRVADDRGLTLSGQLLGTPSYMPPEQAEGKRDKVGPHSDVYSLGAILYELLTGRPPFRAETAFATVAQVLRRAPVAPRLLNPGIPRDLETVCLKCLAKDPARRYASAWKLADDLGRYLAGRPVRARPVSTAERLWRWCKRQPAVAASLLALVTVLLGGTVVSTYFAVKATRERHRADARTEEAQRHLYCNRFHRAELEWVAGNVDRADRILEECASEANPWEWRYLKRLCHPETLTLPVSASAMAFCPGTQQLALASTDPATKKPAVMLVDVDTGKVVPSWVDPRAKAEATCSCLSFSPDGSRLAMRYYWLELKARGGANTAECTGAYPATVTVFDVRTRKEVLSCPGGPGIGGRAEFSGDGACLLVSGDGCDALKLLDAKTGRESRTIQNASWPAAFSPDGRRIAALSFTIRTGADLGAEGKALRASGFSVLPDAQFVTVNSPAIRIWDAATGSETLRLRELAGGPIRPWNLAFSPDAQVIAVCGTVVQGDRCTELYDAKTGQRIRTLFGTGGELAFSADGRLLAVGDRDRSTTLWEVASGRQIGQIRGGFGLVAFHLDGRRVATSSYGNTVKVWDITAQSGSLKLGIGTSRVGRVLFSPDGTRVAVPGNEKVVVIGNDAHAVQGTVALFEPATGRKLGSLIPIENSKVPLTDMAFSPDGLRLATVASGWSGDPDKPDCEVRVWDVRAAKELICFKRPPTRSLEGVAFAGNERLVLGSRFESVEICDSGTGRSLVTLPKKASSMAVSRDGRRLAIVDYVDFLSHISIFDLATGREVTSFRADGREGDCKPTLAYSPDGLFLAGPIAGSPDPSQSRERPYPITVWSVATGKEAVVLRGHSDEVNAVAFSPDGRRLVSGSKDQTVRVWDLATGQALLTLRAHQDAVRTVAFSPDGRRIASATGDEMRIWDGSPLETPSGGASTPVSPPRPGTRAPAATRTPGR